jgi:hypothetical protein
MGKAGENLSIRSKEFRPRINRTPGNQAVKMWIGLCWLRIG